MESTMMNRPEIENDFESFVSKSKSYIDSRNRQELDSIKDEIKTLSHRLDEALEQSQEGGDVNYIF